MGFGRARNTDTTTTAADLGVLALRVGAGALFAGHGAQKLFGVLGGHGLEGTAGFLGSLGLKPAKQWAQLAGISEFGGGALMALGLGGPIGPILMQGAMVNAIRQAHWKLPIWSAAGGPEMALLYSLIGVAVGTTGPGRFSLDRALGVKVPAALTAVTIGAVAAGIVVTEVQVAAAKATSAAAEAELAAADDDGPQAGEAAPAA
ncbi:MAG: DoxX family protein [Thermomicrobiales bacterium]